MTVALAIGAVLAVSIYPMKSHDERSDPDSQLPDESQIADSRTGPAGGSDLVGFSVAVVLCTAVWAVWNESYTVRTFIEGAVLSVLVLFITNRYLLNATYHTVFKLDPLTVLRYVGVLITEIFRSGVHAIYVTLAGRIDVGVVELPTTITNPFHGVLIANAITLTPGTVTIHHGEGIFRVVWIECLTDDADEAGEMIKGRFERVFTRAHKAAHRTEA